MVGGNRTINSEMMHINRLFTVNSLAITDTIHQDHWRVFTVIQHYFNNVVLNSVKTEWTFKMTESSFHVSIASIIFSK